ncbi:hypothetical protein JOD02_000030 [Caldicoprobacter guelmensis]|nr:hypothetical protein [Caldicoprobacter guelmensis]
MVYKTYENVDKLMKYCDSISGDCGYESVTRYFLRYKSDINVEGWFIRSFIKLYQSKNDELLDNGWRNGPVFVMEVNFEDMPVVYLSKFEYEDVSKLPKGVSPADHWKFSDPLVIRENDFFEKQAMEGKYKYFVSQPRTEEIKIRYGDIKRVVCTTVDLTELNSSSVPEKIFGKFDALRGL